MAISAGGETRAVQNLLGGESADIRTTVNRAGAQRSEAWNSAVAIPEHDLTVAGCEPGDPISQEEVPRLGGPGPRTDETGPAGPPRVDTKREGDPGCADWAGRPLLCGDAIQAWLYHIDRNRMDRSNDGAYWTGTATVKQTGAVL